MLEIINFKQENEDSIFDDSIKMSVEEIKIHESFEMIKHKSKERLIILIDSRSFSINNIILAI